MILCGIEKLTGGDNCYGFNWPVARGRPTPLDLHLESVVAAVKEETAEAQEL